MIYIFRREMKKWHIVLWVVFFSLVVSGVSLVFWRSPRVDEVKIAEVNGEKILFKRYKQVLADTQQRIQSLKEYARMLGVSEGLFLKNYYESINPQDVALETTIREALIDQIKNPFNIHLASEYFKEELIRSIPQDVIDEEGRISLDSYHGYLSRLSMTPAEFEKNKEEEFKRQLVERFVMHSAYMSRYLMNDLLVQKTSRKSFTIVVFPFNRFLDQAKKEEPTEQDMRAYYEENKEDYRIPEKHKVNYWTINPEEYAKGLEIDESTIQAFYEKNRSAFRIPPQVRVRHILFKAPNTKDQKSLLTLLKTVQKIYEEAKQNPENFAKLATQYSQDEATAGNGGLTDFFKSGSMDPDFEKAAFRLQQSGDISDIVKTQQGYEIIQLDQRIKASEKPLDQVREEIQKTIKTKRALGKVKSDLEIMIHQVRAGEKEVVAFAQEQGLSRSETDWITADMADKKDTIGLIANLVFGVNKRKNSSGYFFNDGKYILYQLANTQKSSIQKFEDVKDAIRELSNKKKAQSLLKALMTEARSFFFNNKGSLNEFASKNNLKLIQTELIRRGDKINDLSDAGDLLQRIFILNDPVQLMHYRHEDQGYLVQLKEQDLSDTKGIESDGLKIMSEEKFRNSNIHVGAFIASLQKNAKIEIDKNVLKAYKGNE